MQRIGKVDQLPPTVQAMAEMSKHDSAVTINDVIAHAEGVSALHQWANGIVFDSDLLRADLLERYPHLRDRS